MNGLIIEGVTGAGKTSIIAALGKIAGFRLFNEDATFDDFMGDLERDRYNARSRAIARMSGVLKDVALCEPAQKVLLERFHFSHVALDDDWETYDEIDRRCSTLGFKVVLLTIPEDRMSSRALYRTEYDGRDWQGFIQRYGSEASALDALERSQARRTEALRRSRLDHLRLDTSAAHWQNHAAEIANWLRWS